MNSDRKVDIRLNLECESISYEKTTTTIKFAGYPPTQLVLGQIGHGLIMPGKMVCIELSVSDKPKNGEF